MKKKVKVNEMKMRQTKIY